MKFIINKENNQVTIDGKIHSIPLLQKLITGEPFMFPPRFGATRRIAEEFFQEHPEYLV